MAEKRKPTWTLPIAGVKLEGSKWGKKMLEAEWLKNVNPLGPFHFYTSNWKGSSGFTFFTN
jgi:hypothetical protein